MSVKIKDLNPEEIAWYHVCRYYEYGERNFYGEEVSYRARCFMQAREECKLPRSRMDEIWAQAVTNMNRSRC